LGLHRLRIRELQSIDRAEDVVWMRGVAPFEDADNRAMAIDDHCEWQQIEPAELRAHGSVLVGQERNGECRRRLTKFAYSGGDDPEELHPSVPELHEQLIERRELELIVWLVEAVEEEQGDREMVSE